MLRFLLPTLIVLGFLGPLSAQETPYSPKSADRTELIHFGVYDAPPIVFPYEIVEMKRVTEKGRLDFRVIYRIPYQELFDNLSKANDGKTDVAQTNPEADLQSAQDQENANRGLRVFGRQDGAPARFTLGSEHTVFRFVIDLTPAGAHTAVQMRSAISSSLFSGVMPARAPFAPVGANPIPFRWN